MKKLKNLALMNGDSYRSPQTTILDVCPEGILCASPGDYSSADDFIVDTPLGPNDYEQIY